MFSSYILLLNFSVVIISAAVVIVPGIVLAHMDCLRVPSVSAAPFNFNLEHTGKTGNVAQMPSSISANAKDRVSF
jgi:hypothetical protein